MRGTTLIGATAFVLMAGIGAPVMAQQDCTPWSAQNDDAFMENPDTRTAFSGTLMRDLRDLRDAALTLRTYGMDEACQSVTDAIGEIAADPEEMARRGLGEEMAAHGPMTFAQAEPVDEKSYVLRAARLIGSDVRGRSNEIVGEVTDIVVDTQGKPAYVVVAHGGFLGLGEKEIAVPFSHLHAIGEGDILFVAMSEEQLDAAPTFERGAFDWAEDESWRARNDAYFDGL